MNFYSLLTRAASLIPLEPKRRLFKLVSVGRQDGWTHNFTP